MPTKLCTSQPIGKAQRHMHNDHAKYIITVELPKICMDYKQIYSQPDITPINIKREMQIGRQ